MNLNDCVCVKERECHSVFLVCGVFFLFVCFLGLFWVGFFVVFFFVFFKLTQMIADKSLLKWWKFHNAYDCH